MFTQCKYVCMWILIRDIVIVLLLLSHAICATNIKNVIKFAGIVENITVYALEDVNDLENENTLKSLRMNISWMPPSKGKEPSSYSVTITSIPKKTDINRIECPEGSAIYTVQDKSSLSLLVPQYKLSNHMPEIQTRPNCTYKIQVYANPRAKPAGKMPEVIYTVPECIGLKCSCTNAKTILPMPKVKAIRAKEDIIINWNIMSNNSYIQSYVIGIGMPSLISKAGYSVYNITQISNVTFTTNTFTWNCKINGQYVKVENGYKILVAAMDYRGCLGVQGSFTIVNVDKTNTLSGRFILLLLVGVAICIILGFVSILSIRNKNGYQLVWSPGPLRLARWPHLVFQRPNLDTYVESRPEETYYKAQIDKFEVPYKCINFMYELGKGQFGRVYLGNLNNNQNTLVAVKVSQCFDGSNELKVRRQLLEEIKIMKAAGSHPHLVNLIGCCTLPDNPICILLEHMEGGDLLAYLHSKRNIETDDISLCNFEKVMSKYKNIIKLDKNKDIHLCNTIEKQQFMKFALDIARGMEHLEAKGIIHRDLAARNILLTSDLILKISDFGLSRNGIYVINNTAGKVRQLPIRWMSPEAIRDYTFSSKSDVWSFSIVLWEIGTLGSFPYANVQDEELLHYLTQEQYRLTCPNTISCDIYKIMCSCWNTMPQDRPSFAQLVLHLQTLKEPLYSIHQASNPCYTLLSTLM